MFGEHGLIDKRNAYEPSVRVPLLIRAPGLIPPGTKSPVRVRNLDIAPTLLDAAGAKAPPQFEGHSFLPVAAGAAPTARRQPDFVYEYYWEWTFPQTPTTFAIVRDEIKYIQYHGVWDTEELYDLRKDPDERRNLIDDTNYLDHKIALRKALFERLADHKGGHDVPFGPRHASGLVWRAAKGAKAADFPSGWRVEPNRTDRMHGLFPDAAAKLDAERAGRLYFPPLPQPAKPAEPTHPRQSQPTAR
jgi:arylsulfatase A-like enzyme